ncbi:DUF4225 domain-containing protein [Pectobacterium parmentieri]|uniref:DUF4225 domain-containing protein n=1 Tax=Pectobacterium parmentieri TaxID=1905730 RepID=UPI00047302A5|nr:DUF4225 domain-containing protein [Pectobacterium parmentieri]PWD66569.1 DUF4225 domain-containing protein [Pectobacterium parmentieri]
MNEYYNRNVSSFETEIDRNIAEKRALEYDVSLLRNELDQVKNSVANKYIKWSLAKDRFISEVTAYSLDITSKMNTGELTPHEAIYSLKQEIATLKRQDQMLAMKQMKQVIIAKPAVTEENRNSGTNDTTQHINLVIAGLGFVSGGLQLVAGAGIAGTGAGIIPGTLLMAHGFNNVIENGYYLLYRESYTGPVRFVYRQIGSQLGLSNKNSDVIYTFVDIGLSINGLFGYRLTEDAQRLYRFINADLLWGMKQMGMKLMSKSEFFLELTFDANTLVGQYQSY